MKSWSSFKLILGLGCKGRGCLQIMYKVHPCVQWHLNGRQLCSQALGWIHSHSQVFAPLLYCRMPNSRALHWRPGTLHCSVLWDWPWHTQKPSHSINKGEEIIDSLGGLNLALSGHFHFPLILVVCGCTQSVRVSELEQVTRALGKAHHH